jgi:hypothetical protein
VLNSAIDSTMARSALAAIPCATTSPKAAIPLTVTAPGIRAVMPAAKTGATT